MDLFYFFTLNLLCSYFQRRVWFFCSFVEFMFHGRGFKAGLVLKAGSANLANQEGNISMSYQSKAQQAKQDFFGLAKWEKRQD